MSAASPLRAAARASLLAAGVAGVSVCAGCRTELTLVKIDPHLERMLEQQKVRAYDEEPLLPHDMALQKAPEGTLASDAWLGDPLVQDGERDGRDAERIPVHVDRPMVEAGRHDFETFCGPCHGVLGDGESIVAEKMAHRKPPNLHEARIVGYPPGRIFRTIRGGYGLMPSYAPVLSPLRAWGVVAYVRALQIARAARVADLPADVRAELAREAP